MTRHGWESLRDELVSVLGDNAHRQRLLRRVERAVRQDELSVDALADVFAKTGIDSASAGRLLRLWQALIESSTVGRDAKSVAVASRLARFGEYPTRRLVGRPATASWLSETRWRFEPMPRPEMHRELSAYLDAARVRGHPLDQQVVAAELRRFRHRHLLRIFLREIEGASLRRTTAEVADVAESCLRVALESAVELVDAEVLARDICVMGLGKLGGRELNFSSDIDIVFAAADEALGQRRDEHVRQIVRTTVELIDEITGDGRVFRVDLRLRPEGSRGPLVPSESALVNYCLNWGQTWERGAWLKARPVAGNDEMGRRILRRLEPFLYRRHLDFDALDELERMKILIDEESSASDFMRRRTPKSTSSESTTSPFKQKLLRKFDGGPSTEATSGVSHKASEPEPTGWDVKIGKGGIREIEFFVQALQLVHCGTRPELRVRTTLEALDRLLYAGLLSATDHESLADAYDLFRRLEHLIQMESDRQSHRLPAKEDRFADLARRMAMSPSQLRRAVDRSRQRVRAMFERLFRRSPRQSDRTTVGDEERTTLESIIGLDADRLLDDDVIAELQQAGFRRPRQVAGQLQVLRTKNHGPFSQTPSSADPQVARHLLGAIRNAPDPEAALGHLVRFATVVGDTPAMWQMLSENPHAARLLIHLFGSSPPMGGLLAEEPALFERLVFAGSAQVVRNRKEMATELERRISRLSDRARRLGRIRRFHREEIVRIALHEVAEAVEVETTCRQLSDLAEVVVTALFREVVDEYFVSRGIDIGDDAAASVGLAVVGMGKLGGREMGFGSDLDFLLIYDGDDSRIGDRQTATRVAKRVVRALSSTTAIGGLYEVDLRLRPSGRQGLLVVSFESWREYHLKRAEFWERQALIRARPLTGTRRLRERIEQGRRQLAFDRPIGEDARRRVASMRQKMIQKADAESRRFDVKASPGGLVDVEFLTQWLQLSADAEEDGSTRRSTFDALKAVAAASTHRSGGVDLEGLRRDHRWLRRLECRLGIGGLGTELPDDSSVRRALARQMGHQGRDDLEHFDAEVAAVRRRVRSAWRAVFGQ